MTPRRSKARLNVAGAGLVLLVMNVAVFAAVTWPRLTSVRRAETRAQGVASRLAELERLWSTLLARKELVARNRQDIERLSRDHLKPRATDLFAAQREIERLAQEAGLRTRTSTYDIEKIAGTDLVRCQVTLPLDGSYSNLTGFLSRIAATKRFIVVDQMALSENEQGARMSLRLSAVFTEGDANATQ
jgi:Tfp pilus assembly protein PilO